MPTILSLIKVEKLQPHAKEFIKPTLLILACILGLLGPMFELAEDLEVDWASDMVEAYWLALVEIRESRKSKSISVLTGIEKRNFLKKKKKKTSMVSAFLP